LTILFMIVSGLRMQAAMTTAGSLPFALSSVAKARIIGVMTHRCLRGHVEASSHVGTAAPDAPASTVFAAVVGQRRHADQFGDFAPIQLAQFRAQPQHRAADDRAHARDALQHMVAGSPDVGFHQALAQVLVESLDALVQPGDVLGQTLAQRSRLGRVLPRCSSCTRIFTSWR
jgi:hypothetical protein